MSNVEFTEEEKYTDEEEVDSSSNKGFAGFLIKKGIVKNEKQANIVGLVLFLIIGGIALLFI